ncbi:HD domain-containing protein [bacterium]|nr:HD domain-containing protein [bacterium]
MIFCDEILKSLEGILKAHDCYLVGGYLRNYFINGKISADRDIVTLKNSCELAHEISDKTNGTFVELDFENKIYRVVLEDKNNYLDITQANNIEEDFKRRDFTINSIYYDFNKSEIYDPLSARDDIEKKIIRTYDFKNLLDDSLRMLRMYRFMAVLGFSAECNLRNFVKNNFKNVLNCAMERINYEILHSFEGEYIADTLECMFEDDVLEIIFPFVKDIKKIPPNSHHHLDLLHHSIETVRNIQSKNPLLKIAAFYHDIGKPLCWTIEDNGRHRFIGHDALGAEKAVYELKKLKFSRAQIQYITKMIKYHIYPSSLANSTESKKAYARFVKKIGKDVVDLIDLARADRLSARGEEITEEMVQKNLEHLNSLLEFYNSIKNQIEKPKPLLNGKEIMELLNIPPSKKVGEILDNLLEVQLMGQIASKDEACEYIKGLL